jgi:glycosyltransferase involved in cell wall biosynthesis
MRGKEIEEYYFFFNEPLNGVIKSQVIDRIKDQKEKGKPTSILAILHPRYYLNNRKRILLDIPDAIVLPSLGKLKHWKANRLWFLLLKHKLKDKKIICRGPIATNLALTLDKLTHITYDGRGAVVAEQAEYGVYDGSGIEEELFELEKNAVLRSHKQLAVSSKLVEYWRETFNYNQQDYSLTPCVVTPSQKSADEELPSDLKEFFKLNNKRIKLVFSGGNGKWQQIEETCELIQNLIETNDACGLFLCPPHPSIEALKNCFPDFVFQTTLPPSSVHSALLQCDYGIILRENNITNRVASPIKIAEYLHAGLKVILSPNIGDYSDLLIQSGYGIIVKNPYEVQISKISAKERLNVQDFAIKYLTY